MYAIRMLVPNVSAVNNGKTISGIFVQTSNYVATKSINLEAKLGLPERPKKPASPYLMYVKQAYPEYLKASPKLPFKEVVQKVLEQWKHVDMETKTKMMNEYHEKLKKHPEAIKNYYDSLTDAQRVQLEAARQEKSDLKKKKRASVELKKTGKPTRPVSSFGMFIKEEYLKDDIKHAFGPDVMKDISKKWNGMTPEEKAPYAKKYQEAYKVYEKKLVEWEAEMVRQGKESLVRAQSRPTTEQTKKKPITRNKEADVVSSKSQTK